jgi:hypothetical protein
MPPFLSLLSSSSLTTGGNDDSRNSRCAPGGTAAPRADADQTDRAEGRRMTTIGGEDGEGRGRRYWRTTTTGYAHTRRRSCGGQGGGVVDDGGGGRAPATGATATIEVRVRPDPPATWIVVASVIASTLLAKIIVLALAPSATDATWYLRRAADGTSPPAPARKVCVVDALQWALMMGSFLLSVVSLCSIGRSMPQGHECKRHAAPNVQSNVHGISMGGGGGGGGGGSH